MNHWSGFERGAMRLFFALVVADHIPRWLAFDKLPAPNGLARVIDLSFLLQPTTFTACRYLLYGALVLYVLRLGWSFVLPYITLLSVAAGSIFNSQGGISHHLQIVSLVLLAQTAAHCLPQKPGAPSLNDPSRGENRMVQWSLQAIAATYFASALTKLLHTSGMWILRSPLIAVQMIKADDQNFYDTLNPAVAGSGLAVAGWIVQHPLLTGAIMTTGLLFELTSPLLLLGRGWALFYGIGLLAFHQTIDRVMNLPFIYNQYLVLIFLLNVPFWLAWGTRRFRRLTT